MEERTVWEVVFDVLNKHFETYPPASKRGECTKEYIVVKQDGASQYRQTSSEAHYYTLLLYVPQNKYARLERFKKEVKDVVAKELYPLLMPTGLETPAFYDDAYKAHMVSVQYRNNVRNNHL